MTPQDHPDPLRIPDDLWAEVKPLLPPGRPHPLGTHRRRADSRRMAEAVFFILRSGLPWHKLNKLGIAPSSTAHRHFQEWKAAGLFDKLRALGLDSHPVLQGIDWSQLLPGPQESVALKRDEDELFGSELPTISRKAG